MRYRHYILLGSITACLVQAPVSFSDGTATTVSSLAASRTASRHTPHTGIPAAVQIQDGAVTAVADEEQLASQRKTFLRAEQHVKRGDRKHYEQLLSELDDYPLAPLLKYQWLRKHTGDDDGIRDFLAEHGDTRYAWPLRKRWLNSLAGKREWQAYIDAYVPTSDTSLRCYYQRARYNTGDRQAALQAATGLWAVGRSQPKACDPLFSVLMDSPLFTGELVWKRFEAALGNNKVRLARYVSRQLDEDSREIADFWLRLHNQPERYLQKLVDAEPMARDGRMFVHGIRRLARDDISLALALWDDHHVRFSIEQDQVADTQQHLALKLALERDQRAWGRLDALADVDVTSREWQVRSALQLRDWSRVEAAIGKLDAATRSSERWQYWLARAWSENGKPVQAEELLDKLAQKRDYYGYLAAETLGRDYQLVDDPLVVSDRQVKAIAARQSFRMAFELMALDRENQAKLQWWHAVKDLDADGIAAAARLAQRWLWDEIAIFTIARIEHWNDIGLRFPIRYSDEIHAEAALHDIDPAVVFGLIRRESAFNDDASSHAGARGLMQLMPATARQVARELNYKWRGARKLHEAERNIKFGTYYLSKLLDRFNGNHAMSLAAYNAGPHRVKRWLPEATMPADIWIETIPFKETREYVSHVLVYSMIYQQLLGDDELTLADLSGDIEPPVDLAQTDQ